MFRSASPENDFNTGFTLIELLVVIAILSILAGLSIAGFRLYRQRAYDAQAKTLVNALQTSLAAGAEELSDSGTLIRDNESDSEGPVKSVGNENFLPGYVNPPGVHMSATYTASCERTKNPVCLWQSADIHVCGSSKLFSWRKFWNGVEFVMVWNGDYSC